jgi:hypothetical protein
MPLRNDANKVWDGWLVDGLGGQEEAYQKALVKALQSRNIPKCTVMAGAVNMWWRKDSRYIDVTSTLDGSITTTIHIQSYGTSLWIGRALEASRQWNYYKRMAASAFVETTDRCVRETTLTMVDAASIHDVEDIGKK